MRASSHGDLKREDRVILPRVLLFAVRDFDAPAVGG
jgi:hypothetical protein